MIRGGAYLRKERLDVGVALLEAEPALHRHVADVGGRDVDVRRDPQRVLVRPDALDRAHRPRAKPRPGPVGDAEVHRYANERDIELAVGLRECVGSERQAEERCRIGEWPLASLGAREYLRGDRCEFGVVDVAALGVGVFLAQGVELLLVVHAMATRRSAQEWNRPAHYTAKRSVQWDGGCRDNGAAQP